MNNWIVIVVLILLGVNYAHAERKRALLIGISDYPIYCDPELTWNPIHGTNDVELIKSTLRKKGFSVTTITNSGATAKKIRHAFKKLTNDCRAGDLVYIHFSGHGQAYEDLSGDEADGWDEAIVPYDAMIQYRSGVYDGCNHILDDELEEYISLIRTKVGRQGYVYLVLDACHMGGASRGDEVEDEVFIRGTDQGFTPNGKKYIPKIDRRGNMNIQSSPEMSGICILEACRAYQTNAEIKENGRYYGPLTYYINRTLSKVSLTPDSNWIEIVRTFMGKDRRLIKQNMVSEKSN
ncbi:MAG: caspase domain-containing protein [Candidatus Aphodosoma sp.]